MRNYRHAGAVLVFDLAAGVVVVLALAGGLCLFGGQCTPAFFGAAAQNLGVVAVGLVAISLAGAAEHRGHATYALAPSARGGPAHQPAAEERFDRLRPLMFALAMAGAGATVVLMGRWLWRPS